MSGLCDYIAECTRLLYWIFFKPYTLKQWLSNIHSDLEPDTNPYLKLRQFPKNKCLRRYAGQVFWLTTITPQLAVLLIGITYTVVAQETFAWNISELFLTGWIIGQIISRFGYSFFGKKLYFRLNNLAKSILSNAHQSLISNVATHIIMTEAENILQNNHSS